jgi:hypothetical protein
MRATALLKQLVLTTGVCAIGAGNVWATPPVTAGLKFWLDAGDASSLTTNAAGKVSQWADLSGGGHPATQGVASAQAVYCPTGLSGRAALVFSGPSCMETASFVCFSNHTIFLVAQATVTNQQDLLGSGSVAAGDVLMMNYLGKYRGHYWTSNNVAAIIDSTALSVLMPAIYAQRLDDTYLRTYRNGWQDAYGLAGYPHTGLVKPVTVGCRYTGYGSRFVGAMSEVLVYDRALTDAERVQVEEYLASKWLTFAGTNAPPVTGGLKAWFDASDASSVVATNAGGTVSQWNNKAVLWRHAAQTIALYQPLYKVQNGIKWHPSLSFNGTNVLATSAFLNYSNHSVFVVAQATRTNEFRDILGSGDIKAGDALIMNVQEGKYRGHYWPSSTQYSIDSTTPSVTAPVIYEQIVSDTTLRTFRSGVLDGTKSCAVAHTNVFRYVSLGNRATSPSFGSSFIGEMSEVLVYDRALSSNECVQVETYLYEKWLRPRKGTLIRVQ